MNTTDSLIKAISVAVSIMHEPISKKKKAELLEKNKEQIKKEKQSYRENRERREKMEKGKNEGREEREGGEEKGAT